MPILPNIPESRCLTMTNEGPDIVLHYVRTDRAVPCPGCGQRSQRIQSDYQRVVAELPWRRTTVRIRLDVRRFWCMNLACEYQIFCERLDPWLPAYGRRSPDLTPWIADWGWHVSAEALARLALHEGVSVSAATILRVLRMEPDPAPIPPRIVGIDDWALRKGHRYATVIVDLERHQIIEVLPDRQPETVATWLAAHPGITVVSRDRAKGYGKAITTGLPAAIQVADRWHLLKNLGDALYALMTREPPVVRVRAPVRPPRTTQAWAASPAPHGLSTQEIRYQEIQALGQAGHQIAEIARRTGYDRKTVAKYLQASKPPKPAPRARLLHLLDDFAPQLERAWAQGTRTAKALTRVLHQAGYTGSERTVSRWLRQRRSPDPAGEPPRSRHIARRTWVAWFLLPDPAWPRAATEVLSELLATSSVYRQVWTLVHQFHTMLTHRHGQSLDAWIRAVQTSAIPELVVFAKGLLADREAVHNGLTLSWSQGMTEGFNTQIKCLKRVMYGRAHFDLLRRRILRNQS